MYIFGYGSLINAYSRQRTGNTGNAIPVLVDGLQRYWGKIEGSYPISPLVVVQEKGQCNGVLVEVDTLALAEFDKREHGYQRVEIQWDNITGVGNQPLEVKGSVWVYVNNDFCSPCCQNPIIQSYVDTVLAGCLAISPQFAELFMLTTKGWQHAYENDRHQPKYGNLAHVFEQEKSIIDQLVQSAIIRSNQSL
ncbi:gamma-glutamylcyclotransferase [Photobacterium phosphoreum]|uniref:Gamma-glutamylcyclotransferase n=1 Tax=Photobacterium phosphoreum TaxID=659 RepID=A0A2T3JUD3_PHOPO|nr:gamma-glutamylcyclotransferase family protein [Photobacterium phosphoreum]PSU24036.1 gamma-glutamylcyclotransferase [Photobacterium phosphoreum]PSU43705.1 gamma-glutamylcyclotransferase [Photobacterium phosphoreum]PSU52781.1 gamma-glutamylcyclotransferase [Photobacterium phosphoreum]